MLGDVGLRSPQLFFQFLDRILPLAEEVNKTKPVDWNALKTLYLDQEVKHLQPGVVIVIPIKGKLGPLATKIAFGD